MSPKGVLGFLVAAVLVSSTASVEAWCRPSSGEAGKKDSVRFMESVIDKVLTDQNWKSS